VARNANRVRAGFAGGQLAAGQRGVAAALAVKRWRADPVMAAVQLTPQANPFLQRSDAENFPDYRRVFESGGTPTPVAAAAGVGGSPAAVAASGAPSGPRSSSGAWQGEVATPVQLPAASSALSLASAQRADVGHSAAVSVERGGSISGFGVGQQFGSSILEIASADFRDAQSALDELAGEDGEMGGGGGGMVSGELDTSHRLMRVDAGIADFEIRGTSPVNQVPATPSETPNTRAQRRGLQEHAEAEAQLHNQQFFANRVPRAESTQKRPPAVLYDPVLLSQPTPKAAHSAAAADGPGGAHHTPPSPVSADFFGGAGVGPSPVRGSSGVTPPRGSSAYGVGRLIPGAGVGRGVAGHSAAAVVERQTQTDLMIAPNLLCQLVGAAATAAHCHCSRRAHATAGWALLRPPV
jgi:hypothetical protein